MESDKNSLNPETADIPATTNANRRRLAAMGLSVVISSLLMGLKFYTFWLTGSTAILSDALESIINVVAAGFALWSVYIAAIPPDTTHPYGHGKAEFFSAGFEGALIILAAGGIAWQALPGILEPKPLPHLDAGLLILLGTAVANLILGTALVRTGRRTRSAAVIADGRHILTDVYTSAGVLAGLVLVRQTGWLWLDGAIACLVAVNILFIGVRLVRESFSRLMDASDPELLDEIAGIIAKHRKAEWIDIHRLRAWRSGERIHVDFHLILSRELSLEAAHREVSVIQRLLKEHVAGMGDALIHAEPCISPECPICASDACVMREEEANHQRIWNRETITSPAGSQIRGVGGAGQGETCPDKDTSRPD
ncbi:MAG: cation diffusion facilitator family transporter [Syntrophobacteraceae bacterium]